MSIRADTPDTAQFNDWWLPVVRIVWLVAAVAVLLLLIPELQATMTSVRQTCVLPNCNAVQLTARAERALRGIGISIDAYATYVVVLILIDIVVCFTVAVALMWRRSHDRMVLLSAFTCVLICTPNILPLQLGSNVWRGPSQLVFVLGAISTGLLLYVFPTGHFVPRWTALLAAGWVAIMLLPTSAYPAAFWANLPWILLPISIIALQIYRYRRVSNPVQRQQTKLVVLGIGGLCCILVVATVGSVLGLDKQAVPYLLIQTAFDLIPLPIVLSLGLAILRYRLWDVDVLIKRTLVYASLTISLALLYLGGVVSFQALFRATTGQHSDLAIALSTLAIAVLFGPLRHQIQNGIERRFYRSKYDAERVLVSFGGRLRDEVDLAQLSQDLTRVVQETLHPEHVSLWLRDQGHVIRADGGKNALDH